MFNKAFCTRVKRLWKKIHFIYIMLINDYALSNDVVFNVAQEINIGSNKLVVHLSIK